MSESSTFQESGFFWLPNYPQNELPGTLTVSRDGDTKLELLGVFDIDDDEFESNDESRINGKVRNLGLVTLDQCFYAFKPIPFGDLNQSIIVVNELIIGAAYGKDEELNFNSLTFDVDNFAEWVGISGLSSNRLESKHSYRIEFSLPENLEYTLSSDFTLKIQFGYEMPGRTTTEASIKQTTCLRLFSEAERPLEEFKLQAFQITNFLSFAMDKTMTMRNLVAENQNIIRPGSQQTTPVQHRIVYRLADYVEEPTKLYWQQMLFTFPKVKSDITRLLNAWIELYRIADPALNLYFSTIREPLVFSESKFLALAQSMETFHRRTNANTDTLMSEDDYNELRSQLQSIATPKSEKWIEAKLKHGNEINFKKRLLCLMHPFRKILGGSSAVKSIAHKILTSRNYYTHYDCSLENEALKGVDLLNLTFTMEAICKLIFLKHLGFSTDEIDGMLNYKFKQALSAVNRHKLN